jgi:hypothetical protein
MINIQDLPRPDIVKGIYTKYYAKDAMPNEHISSHWKYYGNNIKVDIDGAGNVRGFHGYGFGGLEGTHLINRGLHYLCDISYFFRLPHKRNVLRLANNSRRVLAVMESYLSYECFRQLYSLDTIQNYFKPGKDEDFYVLMIGDGYGFLSALIKTVFPRAKIALVDIGKVLFFQTVNLQRVFPYLVHASVTDDNVAETGRRPDFIYCAAEDLQKLDSGPFRLIINIASMQEMNVYSINRYFKYIRGNSSPDNFFYCCNREVKVLPGGETIEFMKYPWEAGDRHIVDEQCDFYKYFYTWRPPFIGHFDGPVRHRLTKMRIEDR